MSKIKQKLERKKLKEQSTMAPIKKDKKSKKKKEKAPTISIKNAKHNGKALHATLNYCITIHIIDDMR